MELVISADDEDVFWVEDLECEDQRDRFCGEWAAVDHIAEENVSRRRRETELPNDADQVEHVPVEVTDDEEVAGDVAEAGFIPENRQRLECEPIQNLFCEERELVPRTLEDFSVCVHDFRGVLLAIHFGYLQFNLNEWNSEHLSESVGFLMLVSSPPQNAQNLLT